MSLPAATLAYVDRVKVCDYLLDESHWQGATKARFFRRFGFTAEHWSTLAAALVDHGRTHGVIAVTPTAYGVRYDVDGDLIAPDGRRPRIRTVWFVRTGEIAPRLITAYPLSGPSR